MQCKHLLVLFFFAYPLYVVAQDKVEFPEPDQLARFPGCEKERWSVERRQECANQKMLAFIYQHLQYPKEARKAEITGIVIIGFTIDLEGAIGNAEIVKELGFGTGEAALSAVMQMTEMEEPWIPAQRNGENIASSFNMPIMFKL